MSATVKLLVSLLLILIFEWQARTMGGTVADKDIIAWAIIMGSWIIATRDDAKETEPRRYYARRRRKAERWETGTTADTQGGT